MSEGVDLIDIYADEEFNQVSADAASLGEKGEEGKRAQKGSDLTEASSCYLLGGDSALI